MALIEMNRNLRESLEKLQEDVGQRQENEAFLQERIAELEFAIEDQNWERLGGYKGRELAKEFLDELNQTARIFWLKNPLIRRAVLTKTQYVFGQGISFEGEHERVNEVVQQFVKDNKHELTSQHSLAQKETELNLFGNLFLAFHTKATGRIKVRSIPMDEIVDIISDPGDKKKILYYKRRWTQTDIDGQEKQKVKYYPDWTNINPKHQFKDGEVDKSVKIYHISVNKLSDQKFGTSEVYSAIDWARAYKSFLEDWATIVNAQSRFAWKMKTSGGKSGVSKAKSALGSTFAEGRGQENNPPPAAGSTWFESSGVSLEGMKTPGPPTKAEDGDKMIHMVSAGTGIFYHYLTGDPSTGNLASTKSMEMPMLIMFRSRQALWQSIFEEIFEFVIKENVRAPKGTLNGTITKEDDEETVKLERDTANPDPQMRNEPISDTVHVTFPDIVEKDIEARVNAVIKAATLEGKTPAGTIEMEQISRMLLTALKVDNAEEILARMFPEDQKESKTDWKRLFEDKMEELKEAVKNAQ